MAWPSSSARTKTWGTEVLTAADLQGQFDLLHTYNNDQLNGTTGHGHTGGTNDGPKLSLTAAISGILPVANGGTNIASYTIGDILYASASGVLSKLAAGATLGQVIMSAGAGVAPVYGGMTTQGDIEYNNGTTRTRLAAGTSGQFLKTLGAGANPAWADIFSSISDYGTSGSASTARLPGVIKICFGNLAVSGGTSATITNLPFTSTTSFTIVGAFGLATDATEALVFRIDSASQVTVFNNDNLSQTARWFAIGL